MTNWDYLAIFAVWYLLAVRPAIGNEIKLTLATRSLWPLFFVQLIPIGIRNATFRKELAYKFGVLAALFLLCYVGYRITGFVSGNTLIRFLLTFPLASLGVIPLLAAVALLYAIVHPKEISAALRADRAHDSKSEQEDSGPNSDEAQYNEAVEAHITSAGWAEKLRELPGQDEEFNAVSRRVYKAGFLTGKGAKVVGDVILLSLNTYKQNRKSAIDLLTEIEKQFLG